MTQKITKRVICISVLLPERFGENSPCTFGTHLRDSPELLHGRSLTIPHASPETDGGIIPHIKRKIKSLDAKNVNLAFFDKHRVEKTKNVYSNAKTAFL